MSLDVFQQVFTLSANSNLVSYCTGTQECLQKGLQDLLPSEFPGGEWQLVWGPVVWKHLKPDDDTTGPDNSWYVAFHPSLEFEDGSVHPTYVLAIAGTPPNAPHVWETQNLAVDTVTDFRAWVDEGIQTLPVDAEDVIEGLPYISRGTVQTVHFILTTAAPEGAISPGTTLLDFFTNLDRSASPRFIITGHSLGGAVSAPLALSLVSAGVIPADSTLTYPTGALSPGNTAFTELFVETFPARKSDGARSYQGWNLNLVNTFDVIPQAWCTAKDICEQQNIWNVPSIYGTPALPFVEVTVVLLDLHANNSGVLYKPLPSQYFTSSFSDDPPSDLNDFIAIALREHREVYFDEVSVGYQFECKLPGSGVSEKTEIEKRFNYPIIAGLEWAHEHPKEAEEEFEKVKRPHRETL